VRWQASGASGSPVPGTRLSEPVIGSLTPRLWASVIGTRSGLGVIGGSTAKSFTLPAENTIRTSSVFFSALMVEA
jgi:hypothetical protein